MTCLCMALLRHAHPRRIPISIPLRTYATHRDHVPSPLLSNVLDQNIRRVNREDSVGPFQLGMVPPSLGHGEKVKKWNELNAGEKVMRTTARTTNLTVILLGAGLSVLLAYSLTTELFSKNSATVLYGDACERIKASSEVARYMQGPYSFHNTPPSAVRPRHRNRHVNSDIRLDSRGREHMFLTFWITGSDPTVSVPAGDDKGYFDTVIEWTQDRAGAVTELTLDGVKQSGTRLWEQWKDIFRYLSGTPIVPPPKSLPVVKQEQDQRKQAEGSWWGFAGVFSGLRRNREKVAEQMQESKGRWVEGEVHAELVQNDQGYFDWRYLVVDMPTSRNRQARAWVIRKPGVGDFDPPRYS